jgi:hypothetical protein
MPRIQTPLGEIERSVQAAETNATAVRQWDREKLARCSEFVQLIGPLRGVLFIDLTQTLRSLVIVVKAFRAPSISRFLAVAVMLLAWFVITNHCALARLTAQEERQCCHFQKPEPVKESPCQELDQCCTAVKSSLSGKVEVKFNAVASFQTQYNAVLQVLAEIPELALALDFDHGPPRVVSFAESVLQRSLLSHAPPFTA